MPSKKRTNSDAAHSGFKFQKGEKCLVQPLNDNEDIYEAKILDNRMRKDQSQCKIHYKGWNKRWDEWVDEGRLLKVNASNLQIMNERKEKNKLARQEQEGGESPQKDSSSSSKKRKVRSTPSSSSSSHSAKRRRLNQDEQKQKESASGTPPLEIKLPNSLKKKLIGDWESITKQNQVMTLPRTEGQRVCDILRDFEQHSITQGQDKDIVTEIVRGIKDYFNQALQVTLLYKLERPQMQKLTEEHGELTMDQLFGVEHLCRLFVKLPQLLSPTDLDADTRLILKQQIEAMADFVSRRDEYWNAQYAKPAL